MVKCGWLATAMVGLALAGCGGGGSSPGVASLSGSGAGAAHGVTSTTASEETVTQRYNRWAQCMRVHGVQMADPSLDDQGQVSIIASGVDKSTFGAASQACQALHDAAQAANGIGPSTKKPDPAVLLTFAKCMRAHGLPDFPDPSPGGGLSITGGPGSDLNPSNPTFQHAQQACQSIIGSPRGGEKVQVSGPGGGSGGVVSGGPGGGKP
jgi:hypothetical protein